MEQNMPSTSKAGSSKQITIIEAFSVYNIDFGNIVVPSRNEKHEIDKEAGDVPCKKKKLVEVSEEIEITESDKKDSE